MALAAVGLQTHIWNNQLKSALLLLGFPFLLLMMLWSTFYITAMTIPETASASLAWQAGMNGVLDYGAYVVLGTGLWFTVALFMHQHMINWASNARSVTRRELPQIYNMLENLCIARGLPMPRFQIIDSGALNAFASGLSDEHYTITLTRGLVDALEPDELEAVIAHELTHIINRDARLLVISVIFVGMISFFAEMAFRSLRYGHPIRLHSKSNRKDGRVLIVAAIVLMIGYVFALGIRFTLSRKREYLADAGAVELTKNPQAMMRALMRIAGHAEMPRLPDEVKQMCIENPTPFLGMFATHPPIEKRIKVIAEMSGVAVPALVPRSDAVGGPWG